MQPILVAYATTEGYTRKVAEFIAERLRIRGHRVDVVDVATPVALALTATYQAALIGGSVHGDKHQSALVHFVRSNLAWLNAMPTAFFSVGLATVFDREGGHAEAQRCADEFVAASGLRPLRVRLVAGALRFTRYDFFKRIVALSMRPHVRGASADTTHDQEFTDWDELEAFVDDFLAAARVAPDQAAAAPKG